MHIKKVYRYKKIVEVERHHSGRYGKHVPPGPRRKLTTEEMNKINERNCVRKLRRKIQANFDTDDLFLTLTYKKESRPDAKEARKRLRRALDKLRRMWKKEGQMLKYIVVTEYKNKAVHHHMILNDLPDGTGSKKVNQVWKVNGATHNKYLYEDGHYEHLAAYLIKETNKTFRSAGSPSRLRYSCSRNLKNPKPKVIRLKRDNWPENPRVPKGFYLDKSSLVNGIDGRGYRYQSYRLIRLASSRPNKVNAKSRANSGKKKKRIKQTGKNKSQP